MATHGSVGEFQITQETWQSYVERLQQYFIANDVKDATKLRAILLSTTGRQTYLAPASLRTSPSMILSKQSGSITSLCPLRLFKDSISTHEHARQDRMFQRMSWSCVNSRNTAASATHLMICSAIASCAVLTTSTSNAAFSQNRI